MKIDFNDLCTLLTDKYKIDFIILYKDLSVKIFSESINRFIDDEMKENDDVRENFYELCGYENEFNAIEKCIKKDFRIKSIYKRGYYIDIYIRSFKEYFVIFIDDVSEHIREHRHILQDRNNNELLLRELSYDINIHKEHNKYLKDIAMRDNLTGLLNRFGLDKELDNLLTKNINFSLLFLDLDFFKVVNDKYGHKYGDSVLKSVAIRLNKIFSENSIIVRYGGDEFVVILYNKIDKKYIKTIAETTIREIKKDYIIEDKIINIGISIGIIFYPQNANNKYDIIYKADQAMYYAKDKGKNQYCFY